MLSKLKSRINNDTPFDDAASTTSRTPLTHHSDDHQKNSSSSGANHPALAPSSFSTGPVPQISHPSGRILPDPYGKWGVKQPSSSSSQSKSNDHKSHDDNNNPFQDETKSTPTPSNPRSQGQDPNDTRFGRKPSDMPPDHPVHQLSTEEQEKLIKKGVNPVLKAEMDHQFKYDGDGKERKGFGGYLARKMATSGWGTPGVDGGGM